MVGRRHFLFLALLLGAVAVPYVVISGGARRVASSLWNANSDNDQALSGLLVSSNRHPVVIRGGPQPAAIPSERTSLEQPSGERRAVDLTGQLPLPKGVPTNRLSEVLRFDISPKWVISRWPRVSTHLAELELEGLRVTLVTGTAVDDLAGSLTYYFDKDQHVQRISFHGHTGDERKLVSLLTGCCGLKPKPTVGGSLYLAEWNGKPRSVLRISHSPVVRAASPRSRLEVALELNRPNLYYGLSQEFIDFLQQERKVHSR